MQRITWYGLLAVVALVAPIGGQARAPQATARELATLPGVDAEELVRLPNGRVVIYTTGDSIISYDLTGKRGTLLTRGFEGNLRLSTAGDRIAFFRPSEDRKTYFVWGMPIDPATGLAAGPAQRVTVTPGDTPGFSPDGTLLSFGILTGDSNDLAVVPATGGTARTLAKYRNLRRTSWSADGKSVFVVQGTGSTSSVDRVPIDGGPAQRLMSFTGIARGLIDGDIAFYHPNADAQAKGRVVYETASGAKGEFRIPIECPEGYWFNWVSACALRGELSATQSLWLRTTRASTAYAVNLADGKVRPLVAEASKSRAPLWSPDGRRIALQEMAAGQFGITVMNADGSQRRRYPVSNPEGRHMRWSPNGQMLAYYVAPGRDTVAVLDLMTGRTRLLSSVSPNRSISTFIWRPDSRSIVLVKRTTSGDPATEVYEVPLEGQERKLHDFGTTFPPSRQDPVIFISDQLMLIGPPDDQLISIADGTARRIPGAERRVSVPGMSGDGERLFWLIRNADGSITSGQLVDVAGSSRRTVSVPFAVSAFPWSQFHPDGRHVILIGRMPGETVTKIFLVPLNGDAPRVLTQFTGRVYNMRMSPDGTTLVYDVEGAPTTTIHELDVSPILKAIERR